MYTMYQVGAKPQESEMSKDGLVKRETISK